MGMYDHIRIRREMPDGSKSDGWYQTKDLENCLTDYEIDAAGQLWEVGMDAGAYTRERLPVSFTGEIVFYGEGRNRYSAQMTTGKLQSLCLKKEPAFEAQAPGLS
jgi:hypothetical protein